MRSKNGKDAAKAPVELRAVETSGLGRKLRIKPGQEIPMYIKDIVTENEIYTTMYGGCPGVFRRRRSQRRRNHEEMKSRPGFYFYFYFWEGGGFDFSFGFSFDFSLTSLLILLISPLIFPFFLCFSFSPSLPLTLY